MTKEELDELLGTMTKEELKEHLAAVAADRRQREEALRDWVPPPYFTQHEIEAEREHMRRGVEAYAAHEREVDLKIFALGLPRLK
jgi:hypothetical protein